MGARDYERLSVEDFGEQTILSRDLDPVYCALVDAELDPVVLRRWLVAYWCFYDCGVASWMSELKGEKFWGQMAIAATNAVPSPIGDRWRRAAERRHFRGAQAEKAIVSLRDTYRDRPQTMVDYCFYGHTGEIHVPTGGGTVTSTCADVMKLAKEHRGFGDWIGFKVADMLERVVGYKVNFSSAEIFMFDDPRKGAIRVFREKGLIPEGAVIRKDRENAIIEEVVAFLIKKFRHLKAPPRDDRLIDLQEVETVLCKWKSHMNGHYPLRNDIDEIMEKTAPWAEICETAKKFREAMPA